MTKNEHDQIAELNRKVDNMLVQLNQNTKDTASIKLTLAGWSGGRKTLVWVIGVLLTIGVILSSLYATIRSIK